MNTREKINLIDNDANKECVTNAIVNSIFVQYGLDRANGKLNLLETWLHDRIMLDSLADILFNVQKLYVIPLAKKVASDICYNKSIATFDDFKSELEHCGQIGNFVSSVLLDELLTPSPFEFFNEVSETANLVGYEDTLIINDTMYVYDDGSEERILVTAGFSIEYHRNYTCENIERRIKNRLRHYWETEIKSISVMKNEDGSFSSHVAFFCPQEHKDKIGEMLNHRFGKTSGRPWYRCKVDEYNIE